MRVLLLSWEFSPRILGELGRYVDKLAHNLEKRNVDVYVVTFQGDGDGRIRESNGIKVCRVSNPVQTHINILTWDSTLMTEFIRVSSNFYYSVQRQIHLIDVHDWMCIQAAVQLKKAFDLPFLYTIHSLEEHRSNFASAPLNIAIRNLEHLGIVEADRILVKSEWMRTELEKYHTGFSLKIEVVSPDANDWVEAVIALYNTIKLV